MTTSTGENSCGQIETEDLLLELSVLGKDLSSGAALKDERTVAEFQATASSLVERASTLVQRVSREQARLEQLARQVDRPPTTVISPSVSTTAAAATVAVATGAGAAPRNLVQVSLSRRLLCLRMWPMAWDCRASYRALTKWVNPMTCCYTGDFAAFHSIFHVISSFYPHMTKPSVLPEIALGGVKYALALTGCIELS